MTPPEWAEQLRTDQSLRERLDLTWLEDAERDRTRQDWLATWNDVPFDAPFHGDNHARLERCVPLARGPSRSRRLSHTTSDLMLVADPRHPDKVFVSLSHALPALLWNRYEPTADAILDGLAPYLRTDAPSVGSFSRVFRLCKSTGTDRGPIEQSVDYLELWLDDASWCSAFDDDPWQNAPSPMNMMQQSIWLRDVAQEDPARFPSVSWRSLWSKSVLKVEQHVRGLFVFELRYEPANDPEAVEYANEFAGMHLPSDLPVDLAASLLRGDSLDEVGLADMESRGDPLVDRLTVLCALRPGEPTTCEALRQAVLDNPDDLDVLNGVVDLAADYRYDALWFEIAAMTEGTPLGDELRGYLRPQFDREDA